MDEDSVHLNNKVINKILIAWKLPPPQPTQATNNLTPLGSLSALYKQFQLSQGCYSSLISSSSTLWDLLQAINQDTGREITVHKLVIKYSK